MRPVHEIFGFSDLADSPEFEEFCAAFWKLHHIPLALVNPKNATRSGDKLFCLEEDFNPICKVIRSSSRGVKKCLNFDMARLKDAANEHQGICYQCYAGLMDFTVPIYVGKKHIATIICGQILSEAPTEEGFDKLWERVRDLDVDKQALRKAYFGSTYMSPEKIEAVLQLLSFFCDYFCEVGIRLRISERRNKHPEIYEATEYLKKHYSEPIIASVVAEHVGLSRSYFCRLFKKAAGVSFTEYLQGLRLDEVKRLLRETDATISKIAFNCGFGSLPYFNAYFRKMMECSPSQYRAKNTMKEQ